MILKYLCPTCNRYFELGDEVPEAEANCPSCGGLAQRSQARYIPRAPQAAPAVASQIIGLGYFMALLFPLIGFVFGAFFLFKQEVRHGGLCMVVSLLGAGLWVLAFASWLR